MKALYAFLFVVCAVSASYGQTHDTASQDTTSNEENIFYAVDQQAEFPGGIDAMMKFLKKNVSYPHEAKKNRIQGKVYVKFVVEKDGSISNIELIKGVDPELNQEAIRVISKFPKWSPGKKDERIVRSQFVLPIYFSLERK